MNLDYVIKTRGLKFIKKGMKVECIYSGKCGIIKGGNASGNLDILFDGDKRTENCHPTWMMKYFDDDNNVIAEYGD